MNAEVRFSMRIGPGYKTVAMVLLMTMMLSACATLAPQTAKVNYFPTCYNPIAKVREEHKNFTKTVVVSTAVGTVAGALIGYLVGGNRGAIAGAAAGAIAGGGGAYYVKKKEQMQNDEQRRASIASDIDIDTSALDSITLAAIQARKCYREQFTLAISDYKSGRLTKEEVQNRVDEIVGALNEIETIMNTTNQEADKKYKEYQKAIDEEKVLGGPGQTVIMPAAPAPAAEVEAPKKSKKKLASSKHKAAPAPAPAPVVVDKYHALDDPAKKMASKITLAGAQASGASSDAKEYVLSCNALGLNIAGAKKG